MTDWRRPTRRLASGLLFLGMVWFVGRYFYDNLDAARAYEGEWHGGWLLLATAVLLAVYVIQALVWRAILLRTGAQLGQGTAVYVYFFGLLATYIPGRVWGPMGMISAAADQGVPPQRSVTTTVFTTGISLIAAGIIATLLLAGRAAAGWGWLWLLPVILAAGLLLFPQIVITGLNWLLARIGRQPVQSPLGRTALLAVLAAYMSAWILYGLALYFFARAIGYVVDGGVVHLIGANAAAYLAGYAAFFTPAGLGVRELVLSEALDFQAAGGAAAWLSLLSRVWLIGGQLLGFLLSVLASRWRRV